MKSSELKKEALGKLSGNWSKAISITFFYAIIAFLSGFLIKLAGQFSNVLQFITFIFLVPLLFGITVSIIKLVKGETVSVTAFIDIGLKNISKVWSVHFNIFLKLLIPVILMTVFLVVGIYLMFYSFPLDIDPTIDSFTSSSLIVIFAFIYATIFGAIIAILLIPYSLSLFILYDNPDMSGKEIVNKSKELMYGNKKKFVFLMFSFLGWFILVSLITSIANVFLDSNAADLLSYAQTVLLTPYITATQFIFYEYIKNRSEKSSSEETPVEN